MKFFPSVLRVVFFIFIFTYVHNCTYYTNFTAYYNTFYNAKESFKAGEKLYLENRGKDERSRTDKKYFEDAIEKCWKLLEFHGYDNAYSDDAVLLIAKGEFYLDRYISAKQHLDGFFDRYPNSDLKWEGVFYRAWCDLALGDTAAAVEQFNTVIISAGKQNLKSLSFLKLGEIEFTKKNYQEAAQNFQKAIKAARTKQQRSEIYFYLAESYYKIEDFQNALKFYKQSLESPPNDQTEYLALLRTGECLHHLGKSEEAIRHLEKILTSRRFQKWYGEVYATIANIYRYLNDLQSAVYYYHAGIDAKSALSAYYFADFFENEMGNIDSAVFYYQKVPVFDKNSPWSMPSQEKLQFLRQFQGLKKNVDRAETFLRRWKNDPAFRDSVENIREMNAKFGNSASKIQWIPFIELLEKISSNDTTRYYHTPDLIRFAQDIYPNDRDFYRFRIDSLQQALQKDSLLYLDTLRYSSKDTLARLYFDYIQQQKLFRQLTSMESFLLKSPEEIENEYRNYLVEYADFFLLETPFVDSAIVYYTKFLEQFDDSVQTPKALYALATIYQNKKPDPTEAQKYQTLLLTRYPNSPYAQSFSRKMKTAKNDSDEQLISNSQVLLKKYRLAEEYFEQRQFHDAVRILQQLKEEADSASSNLYPKILYFLGYIYEKGLVLTDSAMYYYQLLKDRFAETEYGKMAAIRLSPPKELSTHTVTSQKEPDEPALKPVTITDRNVYDEETRKRILQKIESLLGVDYSALNAEQHFRRFWSKNQLREFQNEISR